MSNANPFNANASRQRYLLAMVEEIDPAADPLAVLKALHELAESVAAATHAVARECVERGDTYGAVGEAVGITRQAARLRYPAK